MLFSKLFVPTIKETPGEADVVSHKLMVRAGLIRKLASGVYEWLPVGYRVLKNVERIIREEMDAIGGQEVWLPALLPRALWDETGRWEKLASIMYQFESRGKHLGLGTTHEEPIVHIVRHHTNSYKDLPLYLYQIQDKFRNEPRAKSGLLRGREFSMKDLYSFHRDEKDLQEFYAKAVEAYRKIFSRCGLEAIVTEASGGEFRW